MRSWLSYRRFAFTIGAISFLFVCTTFSFGRCIFWVFLLFNLGSFLLLLLLILSSFHRFVTFLIVLFLLYIGRECHFALAFYLFLLPFLVFFWRFTVFWSFSADFSARTVMICLYFYQLSRIVAVFVTERPHLKLLKTHLWVTISLGLGIFHSFVDIRTTVNVSFTKCRSIIPGLLHMFIYFPFLVWDWIRALSRTLLSRPPGHLISIHLCAIYCYIQVL